MNKACLYRPFFFERLEIVRITVTDFFECSTINNFVNNVLKIHTLYF